VIRFSSLHAFLVLGLGVILLGVCLFLFAGKVASHPPVKAKSEKPYLDVGAEIQTLIRAYDEKISQLSISEGEEREHQQAALRKLRPYGKNAVKPLLELLTNRTYRFSKASHALAYTALEEIDPVALYIHILTYSKKPDARRKAAKRLGDIADKKALQALKQHLNDDDQAVRKIATDTIAFYSAVGEI
jgi:HEAT repeat protein